MANTTNKYKLLYKYFSILVCIGIIGSILVPWTRADQTLTVTGSIPPKPSDFQISYVSDASGTQNQNSTITYTITYGSHLYYPDQFKIEAQWYRGTIQGQSSPSVDGVEYAVGSASKAYNNTSAVVDSNAGKIDWTINAFPPQTTDQTVTFRLSMTGSYQGTSHVNFPIAVRLITPEYTSADQLTSLDYLFDPSLVPPRPTPTPTILPTPLPSHAPVVTQPIVPSPLTPKFLDVNFFNLSSDTADINYVANQTGDVTIFYGTSPQNLSQKQTQKGQNSGIFSLTNLTPQKQYFFQLSLTNKNGTVYSEIFTFTTPTTSAVAEVVKTSLVIASDNDVLYSSSLNPEPNLILSIAPRTNYTLAFRLTKADNIRSVALLLQNNSVLGIMSVAHAKEPSPQQYSINADSRGDGVYVVNVSRDFPAGQYKVFIVVRDTVGNVASKQVAILHILHPIQVYDSSTKLPVADTRVTLFVYDTKTKKYTLLAPVNGLQNPLFTDTTGETSEQLRAGKYKAVLSHIGYRQEEKIFTIGSSSKDDYPTVYLHTAPVTIGSIFIYYKNAFIDWAQITNSYIASLQQSNRYFNLVGLLSLFYLATLTLLFFSFKTHVFLMHVPYYIHHHTLKLFGKETTPYLHGTIIDGKTKQPVSKALVISIDEKTQDVLNQTITNKTGSFLLPFDKTRQYVLSVIREGYQPLKQIAYQPDMVIALEKGELVQPNTIQRVWSFMENLFGMLFEFLFVASMLLEIILFPSFGLAKTFPFIIISILNLILWFIYERERLGK